jgi:predicted metal-dependent phosphoesterase TrpH
MRLDLHIHTTASDGTWTPEQVSRGARVGGLDVIAIADHDTVAAVHPAREAAAQMDVQVIPALEASSTWQNREIHILGYFVDLDAPGLVGHTRRASELREARMREILSKLHDQGVEVPFEDVEHAAGAHRVNLGRPHLARALVSLGYATSVSEAFTRLIGDDRPAFVPTRLVAPEEAVALILESGGIPVWAHPPGDLMDVVLPRLVQAGLRGLEVYRPSHDRNDVLRLEAVCRSTGLLCSGGSDWHTPEGGAALGDFHVTADEVEALLEAGGM